MTIFDFNSIKVRLKLGRDRGHLVGYVFQFHKGTIKTVEHSRCDKRHTFISIP